MNLLLEKFPAFAAGAENGAIGTRIGLYIYCAHGDKDGKPEHGTSTSTLAYVAGDAVKYDDGYKYSYMLGIDAEHLARRLPGS